VGELVFRCPNHQPVEVPLAIGRADFSAAEKGVVTVRKQSDRYAATHQPVEVTSARDLVHTGTGPLPLVGDDMDLVPLLRQASNEELAPLVEYILNKGGLSAELDATIVFKKHYPNHRMYADDIAAEIQKFGANTFWSQTFRKGRGKKYGKILRSVAKRCGVKVRFWDETAEIEERVLEAVLSKASERMTDQQRQELLDTLEINRLPGAGGPVAAGAVQAAIQAAGFAPYKLAVIVANGMANAVLGHGLALAANAGLVKALALFAGPVGWAFDAIWGGMIVAGPAYRVTIPCVVQVAFIRQSILRRQQEERRHKLRAVGMVALITLACVLAFLIVRHFMQW
jgi:uncharacterized protein YaaW (UPF0174 family)